MAAASPSTSLTLLDRLGTPDRDRDAWARFARLYAPLLHEWARRQGFHDADAADLTQDVLVKLLHELPGYVRGEGQSFRGWLFRMAANQCRDFRRRKATRRLPPAGGLDGTPGKEHAPFAEFEEDEYRRFVVHRALSLIENEFTPATRRAFESHSLAGRPAAEVAAELGTTPNAVYLACNRVLTRLREEIRGLVE